LNNWIDRPELSDTHLTHESSPDRRPFLHSDSLRIKHATVVWFLYPQFSIDPTEQVAVVDDDRDRVTLLTPPHPPSDLI
jgi:hypothetical protein